MGWQDAPIIEEAPSGQPAWMSAPVVEDEPAAPIKKATDSLGQQFASGMNEHLRETVGGLGQMMEAGLPGARQFREFVEDKAGVTLRGAYDQAFVGPDPTTPAGRAMRHAGTTSAYALEFAAPEAALARSATLLRGAVTSLTPTVERVGRAILEPFRTAPGRATALTVASGGAAGIGEQRASEIYPDSEVAPLVGGIVGGMSPVALPAVVSRLPIVRTVSKAFGAGRDAVTEEGRAKIGASERRKAVEQIRRAATPADAQREVARVDQVREEIGLGGKTDYTIAQRTNSPRLITDQIKAESEMSGASLDSVVKRKESVLERIGEYQSASAPAAGSNAAAVAQRTARDRVRGVLGALTARREEAEAQLAAVGGGLSRADKTAVGQKVRAELQVARQTKKQELQALAAENGLNDDVRFPVEGLEGAVQESFGPTAFGPRSPILRELRGYMAEVRAAADEPTASPIDLSAAPSVRQDIAADAATIGWQDLQMLRTRISDELSTVASSNSPDKGRRLGELLRLRRTVDKYTDNAAPEADPARPDLPSQWREFRGRWRDEYASVYERGQVYKALRPGNRADHATVDEKVAESFLTPTGVRQFTAAGGDPRDLRAVAIDRLAAKAIRPNGQFNVNAYRAELNRMRAGLPAQVAQEFEQTGAGAQAIAARLTTLEQRRQTVQRGLLANALRKSGRDPDRYVAEAIRNPDLMEQAVKTARPAGAEDALRAAVWREAFPGGEVNTQAVREFMSKHRKSLDTVFTPQHLKAIKTIADAMDIEARILPTRGSAERADAAVTRIEEELGTTVPGVSSRLMSIKARRISGEYAWVDMATRFWSTNVRRTRKAALAEALTNPEMAEQLAAPLTGESRTAMSAVRDFYGIEAKDTRGFRTGRDYGTGAPQKRSGAWLWTLGVAPPLDSEAQGAD